MMKERLRSALKKADYLFAWALTGFAMAREGEAAILMYHAVDESDWKHSIHPEEFERQIAYLRRMRIVVPLADVVAAAKGEKRLPPRATAVTIDDGYADLVPTILPILKRYRVPATLFLTTDLNERTNSSGHPRVSWEDIERLVESGWVSIQSHGRTHRRLSQLPEDEVRSDIVDAQADIKRHLGEEPPYFAYPYGDRSPEVEKIVEEAGYQAAFAITEGFVEEGSHLFHLPRIQVDATMSPLLFALRLTPALMINRKMADWIRAQSKKIIPKAISR